MDATHKDHIRRTFALITLIAPVAASLFYDRLFEIAPETQNLFRYPSGSPGMAQQGTKLMQTLGIAVSNLDNLAAVIPAIEALARRHVAYGVEPIHYDVVGASLLWTLEQGLGAEFTHEVQAAWATLYTTLADVMKQAAYGPGVALAQHSSAAMP